MLVKVFPKRLPGSGPLTQQLQRLLGAANSSHAVVQPAWTQTPLSDLKPSAFTWRKMYEWGKVIRLLPLFHKTNQFLRLQKVPLLFKTGELFTQDHVGNWDLHVFKVDLKVATMDGI